MSLADRLDGWQRRHRSLGYPIAVVYKVVDDQGSYLAALVAYYAFLSLFPLLLLLTTVLSFVLAGNPALQADVLATARKQIPVVGDQLAATGNLGGGALGIVVGVGGALLGGLGVANAVQNAMNTAWRVPRHRRPNPLASRVRSLELLATVGVLLLATTALSALGGSGTFAGGLRVLALLGVFVLNAGALVVAFRRGTTRALTVRDVLPGALVGAAFLQVLQVVGKAYVNHVIRNASATNSVFATVLGLLAFLYLASLVLVLCLEANAVRVDGLWPRALLTPFTDDVDLTPGDRRAYAESAKAQAQKGFETVDVRFERE